MVQAECQDEGPLDDKEQKGADGEELKMPLRKRRNRPEAVVHASHKGENSEAVTHRCYENGLCKGNGDLN